MHYNSKAFVGRSVLCREAIQYLMSSLHHVARLRPIVSHEAVDRQGLEVAVYQKREREVNAGSGEETPCLEKVFVEVMCAVQRHQHAQQQP